MQDGFLSSLTSNSSQRHSHCHDTRISTKQTLKYKVISLPKPETLRTASAQTKMKPAQTITAVLAPFLLPTADAFSSITCPAACDGAARACGAIARLTLGNLVGGWANTMACDTSYDFCLAQCDAAAEGRADGDKRRKKHGEYGREKNGENRGRGSRSRDL